MDLPESCKCAVIGPGGGRLYVGNNILDIPRGALSEPTEIAMSVTWKGRSLPQMGPSELPVSATLTFEPSGLRFARPARLAFHHCLSFGDHLEEPLHAVLYSNHDEHLTEDDSNWESEDVSSAALKLEDDHIWVTIQGFSTFQLALRDGSQVEAKNVWLVAYSDELYEGENQQIRLHIFDQQEELKQKIQMDEEKRDGKCISVFTPFMYRRLCGVSGDLSLEVQWHTPGWSLISQKVSTIPFNHIWYMEHTPCELHFINEIGGKNFNFQLKVEQDGNPDISKPCFASHIKNQKRISSPVVRPRVCRPQKSLKTLESIPIMESNAEYDSGTSSADITPVDEGPIRSPLASQGGAVGGARGDALVPGGDVLVPGGDALVPLNQSTPRQASRPLQQVEPVQNHFNQFNLYLPNHNMLQSLDSVIPFDLRNRLAERLNDKFALNDWSVLAKRLDIEDVSSSASRKENPALCILTVAENRRKITDLLQLKDVFQEIGRDDLAEMVDQERKSKIAMGTQGDDGAESGEVTHPCSLRSDDYFDDINQGVERLVIGPGESPGVAKPGTRTPGTPTQADLDKIVTSPSGPENT